MPIKFVTNFTAFNTRDPESKPVLLKREGVNIHQTGHPGAAQTDSFCRKGVMGTISVAFVAWQEVKHMSPFQFSLSPVDLM